MAIYYDIQCSYGKYDSMSVLFQKTLCKDSLAKKGYSPGGYDCLGAAPGCFFCGLALLLAFGCFLYRRLRPGVVGKV